MPPTGIMVGIDEGAAPSPPHIDNPTPADASNIPIVLLELSSSDRPANLHTPMTCTEVESHISPVPLLAWADIRTASFGCVDGRATDGTLATWGGDLGEFITALNVYEQMATLRLSQADVTNILRKYLEATNRHKFTTCMSGLTITQMFGSQAFNSVDDMESAIKNPSEDKVAALWMKIADPNYIGNDHIKFMLEHSNEFSVRKELVQHVVHSFFDILWNQFDPLRSKLHIQVLAGDHEERAVVSVSAPDFCINQAHLAPLVPPRIATSSIALINPDAVQVLRRELSIFFSRETSPVVRADELSKRFNVLAAGQGALSKKLLFDRIPTFSARISQ